MSDLEKASKRGQIIVFKIAIFSFFVYSKLILNNQLFSIVTTTKLSKLLYPP